MAPFGETDAHGRVLDPARVLDAMADGIVIVDRSGTITFTNLGLQELSGYSSESLIGASIELLVPERARIAHHLQRDEAQSRGELTRPMGSGREITLRRRDGTEIPVDIALSQMGAHVLASVRDARTTRAMQAALAEERRRGAVLAERARIARDLHDGIIQQLFAVGLALRASDPEGLQKARDEAVNAMDAAIRDLRLYVTGLADEAEPRSLTGALTELVTQLRSASPVPIEPMIDAQVARRVAVHGPVLVNFAREAISNAMRHSRCTRIDLNLRAEGDEGLLEIADDGTGFDPETITSTGIGLTNLRARAAAIGGRFTLRSMDGDGTRVQLRIPLREERRDDRS